MDINELGLGKDFFTQREDGNILQTINDKTINQITKEYAFEILKNFLGESNPYYDLLSIDELTLVNPGVGGENSKKYIYNWGASIIQILFFISGNKLTLSVKKLS